MTTDALRSVLKKMPLKKRLEMAAMDEEILQLATCFHDIDSLLLDDEVVVMGGKEPVSQSPPVAVKREDHHHLEKIFLHCPAILRVFVQTKLSREEWRLFGKKMNTLQKLYISNENFTGPRQWADVQFHRLKSLGILQRQNQQLRLTTRMDADCLKPVLSATLHRVCLTGVVLLPDALRAIFALPDLRSLDLIGALMDSKEAAAVIPTLKSPPRLQEVSFPPSLFSFTKGSSVKFDFRWLKVSKLCLYMEYFHEETFNEEIGKMFHKELKSLVLYGNVARLQVSPRLNKYKYTILFGPSESATMSPSFAENDCLLVGHLVRHSPYTRAELAASRTEYWKIDLGTAVDDQPVRIQREPPGANVMRMFLNGIGARPRPADRLLPGAAAVLAPPPRQPAIVEIPGPLAPSPPPVANIPAVAPPVGQPPAPQQQQPAAPAPPLNIEEQVINDIIQALLNNPNPPN